MNFKWYVVHVYSGSEKRVVEAINDQIVRKGMQDYFEEVLMPTEEGSVASAPTAPAVIICVKPVR